MVDKTPMEAMEVCIFLYDLGNKHAESLLTNCGCSIFNHILFVFVCRLGPGIKTTRRLTSFTDQIIRILQIIGIFTHRRNAALTHAHLSMSYENAQQLGLKIRRCH